MTRPTGHEREPDRAALDELEQAFGGATAVPDGDTAGGGPTQPVGSAGPPNEELLIVEAEPVEPNVEPAPAPRVIRIDDYGGSVVIDAQPDEAAAAPATTEPQAEPPLADEVQADEVQADEVQADEIQADEIQADEIQPIVIEIDDADLPDAVYVEGSLDRDGPRSIVIIEDDDMSDALAPETERDIRRGIEPRMRERRVAVKRAQGRKRLKWVGLGVLVVVVVVGTLAVLGSGLFAVKEDQVFITGNVYTNPEQLQAVIDEIVGTPVLLVDTQAAERQLEAIPWVEAARVRTDFPHGATVEIRERQAIATYRGPDQRFRVLDREGRVLDVIDLYPIAYLRLDGPDPVDLDAGEFAPRGYAAAAELAKNLTGSVRGNVDRIEVTADGGRLVMFLVDGTEVRFGEARDLFAKLVRLETVLASGEIRQPGVIDISTNEVTL